jgi:hypothetical protein
VVEAISRSPPLGSSPGCFRSAGGKGEGGSAGGRSGRSGGGRFRRGGDRRDVVGKLHQSRLDRREVVLEDLLL